MTLRTKASVGDRFLSEVSRTIDTALDRSIAFGYGNVGLVIRRRLAGWPADLPRMDGSSVLVTGAASGLGLAAARGFATLGATVYALARDELRAAEAVRAITDAVRGADAHPVTCDLADLDEIRTFAEAFASRHSRLDVLVNNAGVMPDERSESPNGHELMFATHVLAPIALSLILRGPLSASSPGRVINVSSGGMYGRRIPSGDLESRRVKYGPKKLYARTKREQVVVTEQVAQLLQNERIVVHAMHPGWADTEGVRHWMPSFRALTRPIIRTPEQGADTIVWLGAATEPAESTGRFWHDRRQRPTTYRLGARADGEPERAELWEHCRRALEAAGIATGAARIQS